MLLKGGEEVGKENPINWANTCVDNLLYGGEEIKMNIFFVDDQHKENFLALARKFPAIEDTQDYRSSCYLLALPEIFKAFSLKAQQDGPFGWYVMQEDYENTSNLGALTGTTRRMVELALNFFNSNVDVDMTSLIVNADPPNYMAILQAIDLRRSRATFDFTK